MLPVAFFVALLAGIAVAGETAPSASNGISLTIYKFRHETHLLRGNETVTNKEIRELYKNVPVGTLVRIRK